MNKHTRSVSLIDGHIEGMTDAEIKKALERCGYHNECCYCNSVEECGSKKVLVDSVLALINRQQAKIERLKNIIESVNEDIGKAILAFDKDIAIAKSEAIKEFAERFKEKATKTTIHYVADTIIKEQETGWYGIFDTEFDNLVKEMTEGCE